MGFIVTTILGIVGALIATYAGQAMGWYRAGEGAGFIASVIGAMILLFLYHLIMEADVEVRHWASPELFVVKRVRLVKDD